MSDKDPLAPMARLARRIPGYPFARRLLLPRIRSSITLRAIAHKLWVTEVTPDGRGADLTAGNVLSGVGAQALPVVVFVLDKVPDELIDATVDEIARVQLLTAGFRPVLLLGRPEFGVARKYGYPAELMLSPSEGMDDEVRYWQRIRRTYGTGMVCDIPDRGLTLAQRGLLLSMVHEV